MFSTCLWRAYMCVVVGMLVSIGSCCPTRNPPRGLKKNPAKDGRGVEDALQFFEDHAAELEFVHAEAAGQGGDGGGVEEVDLHRWDEERRAMQVISGQKRLKRTQS